MAPSIETSIWLALKRHIETLDSGVHVSYPGPINDLPIKDGMAVPYIRVAGLSVAPTSIMIDYGKAHNRTGTLMLTVVYPLNWIVELKSVMELASYIARHFRDGTHVQHDGVCVEIPNYPHVMDGYEDSGYWTVPVSIPWRCFA